jgi:tellurite methyltransferase
MQSGPTNGGEGLVCPQGGYDEGYSSCACFWGRAPGSLVHHFLETNTVKGHRVLDLGCGEGKNAYALSKAGAIVTAVDCSELALKNGKREFGDALIEWVHSDCSNWRQRRVLYGR